MLSGQDVGTTRAGGCFWEEIVCQTPVSCSRARGGSILGGAASTAEDRLVFKAGPQKNLSNNA